MKPNPNRVELAADFHVWREAKTGLRAKRHDMVFARDVAPLRHGKPHDTALAVLRLGAGRVGPVGRAA